MTTISSNYGSYNNLFATGSTGSSSNIFELQQELKASSMYGYGSNSASLSSSQQSSLIGFKDASTLLNSTLTKILSKKNDGGSVFGDYSANSSNTDAVTAKYTNDINKYSSEALEASRNPQYAPTAPEDLALKVVQLATTQKNTGSALNSKEMSFEEGKTYRFEISDGDKTTSLAFVAEKGDTNESVQKKMAAAINDKNIGVKATMNYNGITGTSSLVLESRKTGVADGNEHAFEVRDASGYDAVAKSGIGNITEEAQNAIYYVGKLDKKNSTDKNIILEGNAELRTSMSNDVNLTDRTSATLKKATSDYVGINFKNDSTSGLNAVRDLVNGYNALFDNALKNSEGNVHSARLATQLAGTVDSYRKSLSEIGIDIDGKGYLTIDEEKMEKAADSGALEKFFSSDRGSNYGFANKLKNYATTVGDNPSQYVEGITKEKSTETSATKKAWEAENASTTSNYSKLYFNLQKYENMGALFNSLF